MINKDTKLFGSFSKKAGNTGCKTFNTAFKQCNIDAIYRSFSVNDIKEAVQAARCLNFSGFAISMPFKFEVVNYVDQATEEVHAIGAANTVINKNGILVAYNTDFLAVKDFLKNYNKELYILGDGGYAAAVKYAVDFLNKKYTLITRSNWNTISLLKNKTVFNCTPVENIEVDSSNDFIDCLTTTETGKRLAFLQACKQFKLYTGLEYPLEYYSI
jgi:shikimate dehydrogenase